MTTHELARKLLAGPNVLVVTGGQEGGQNEIQFVSEPRPLHLNYYPESDWWFGRHQFCYHENCDDSVIDAISLS